MLSKMVRSYVSRGLVQSLVCFLKLFTRPGMKMEWLDLCPHLKSMNFLLEIIFMVCIVSRTGFYGVLLLCIIKFMIIWYCLLSIITSGSYLDSWCSKPFVYNFHSIFDISNAMGTFEDLTISTFTEHSSGYHVLILKTWRANWWTQSSSTAARALRTNVNWSRN